MSEYVHDVFISYRHEIDGCGFLAGNYYDLLTAEGYDVFIDHEKLEAGDFPPQLESAIVGSECIICVLPPNGLNRCKKEDDWIRREIRIALAQKKKIIPVFMKGFNFDNLSVPEDISDFLKKQRILDVDEENYKDKLRRIRRMMKIKPRNSEVRIKKKYIVTACGVVAAFLLIMSLMFWISGRNKEHNVSRIAVSSEIVIQSEDVYTKLLKQQLNNNEIIDKSLYYDYDNDGTFEMYSIVLDKSKKKNNYSLWFINLNGCKKVKVLESSEVKANIKLLSNGKQSLLNLELPSSIAAGTNYIFGVNNNEPVETAAYVGLHSGSLKSIDGISNLFCGYGGSAVYPNAYFFYINKGKLKEYGFVPCNKEFVEQFENGKGILHDLSISEKCLSIDRYYRSDKIISVHYKIKWSEDPDPSTGTEYCDNYYISNNELKKLPSGFASSEFKESYCFNKDNAVFPKV